jgi:hypothetical protein
MLEYVGLDGSSDWSMGGWVCLVGVAGGYCMGSIRQNYALVMLYNGKIYKCNNIVIMYSLGMAQLFLN